MNKFTKSKKLIVVGTTLCLLTISAVATPIFTTIQANLNKAPIYTLNATKIMDGVDAINYSNKTYVPIEDLAIALGLEVTTKDNNIDLKTPIPKEVTIPKALIKEVNLETNQVTVLPEGKSDSYENYIVLNLSKDTTIQHEKLKKVYTLKDLTPGLNVKVVHSPIMTSSLPPQTPTYSITILESSSTNGGTTPEHTLTHLDDVTIQSIDHAKKQLVVKDKSGTLTQVPFTNKTKVEWDNHKKPNANSLKVGQIVDIELKNGVAIEIEIED